MKVFISWSGDTSRRVARALRDWLPKVIQSVKPFMSDEDIEAGRQWRRVIDNELQTDFGIICLTKENLDSPWIHFEAGALAKALDESSVCPYLFGIKPTDVGQPLGAFQGKLADEDGTFRIVRAMNESADPSTRLGEDRLKETFDTCWHKLDNELSSITVSPAEGPIRDERDIMEEILAIARRTARHLSAGKTASPSVFPLSDSRIIGSSVMSESSFSAPSRGGPTSSHSSVSILPPEK